MKRIALVSILLAFPGLLWAATATKNLAINITGAGIPTYTYNFTTGACTPSNGASATNCIAGSMTAGVCNGTTAQNDAALNSFNDEAQKHTRPAQTGYSGGGTQHNNQNGDGNAYADANITNQIVLNFPACNKFAYTYPLFPTGIRNVSIVGAGSGSTVFQNLNTAGHPYTSNAIISAWDFFGDTFYGQPAYGTIINSPYGSDEYGHLINTANAGATTVTLTESTFASEYFVGRWVMVMSYVQDSSGSYPPNMRYYDFGVVTAVNLSTGVITLDPTTMYQGTGLRFTHLGCAAVAGCTARPYNLNTLSDAAVTASAIGAGQVGPARIVPIDTPQKPMAVTYNLQGIHFLHNPTLSPPTNPVAPCNASGIYPACCAATDGPVFQGTVNGTGSDLIMECTMESANLINLTLSNSSFFYEEADKNIGSATYNNVTALFSLLHSGDLLFHAAGGNLGGNGSANGGEVTCAAFVCQFDGGVILSAAVAGNNPDIQLDRPNFTDQIIVNGAAFHGSNSLGNTMVNSSDDTPYSVTIGSGGVSFSGNRLTVSKCNNAPSGGETCWDMEDCSQPACKVIDYWGDGGALITNGTMNTGVTVSSMTGDATHIYVDFSGTPAFANGQVVAVGRVRSVSVTNSTASSIGNSCVPASGPNNCLRYPTHVNIPSVTWSGNTGG